MVQVANLLWVLEGAAQQVAARTVVARGRVGRRVGEWQRRVGPGEGDSPQVRVPLGRASGPGVRPVGPSSRARWVRVAPVSAQRSAHSAPNRADSPHFCARLGHFSARLGHSFVRIGHFSARLGHSFVRLGHLSGRLGRALYLWLRKFPGFAADALHDSSRCRAARVCHEGGAGLSPCAPAIPVERCIDALHALQRHTSSVKSRLASCQYWTTGTELVELVVLACVLVGTW